MIALVRCTFLHLPKKTAKPFSRRRLHFEMVKNLVFFNSDEEFL